MSDPQHPTYGTLDELLAEIKRDVTQGYFVRVGLQGALNWFSRQYSYELAQDAKEPPR